MNPFPHHRIGRAALRLALPLSLYAACAAASGPTAAGAAVGAPAASVANRYAAAITPLESFDVAGVLVERHGTAGGRPLVLVPGLAGGSWVWQDTIRAFAASHPVYVLTLPGFDGRPPAGDRPFAAARAAVAGLIATRHLDRPVLVGHGLGGVLALALAEDQPRAVGGIVSIDGLPVMPGTEELPPGARLRFAADMAMQVGRQPTAAFAAQQQTYMRTIGTLDMDRADALALLAARSDPPSVGRYAADMLTLDLRPGLASIAAPVLVVMPYFSLDAEQQGQTVDAKLDDYRTLMAGTPALRMAAVAPARHFAMFDQPQAVNDAIRAFLEAL